MGLKSRYCFIFFGFLIVILLRWYSTNRPGNTANNLHYKNKFESPLESRLNAHVFVNFDVNGDGFVDVREFLCSVSMSSGGKLEHKLKIAFAVYDMDDDGWIMCNEMQEIVSIIYDLVPDEHNLMDTYGTPENHAGHILGKMDKDKNARLSIEEFVAGFRGYPTFYQLLICDKGSKY